MLVAALFANTEAGALKKCMCWVGQVKRGNNGPSQADSTCGYMGKDIQYMLDVGRTNGAIKL